MPPQATQPYLTVTKGLAVVPEGTSTAKFAVNEYGDAYFAGAVRIDGELQLSGGGTPGLTMGNNEFLAGLTTLNVVKRLIGVNSSNEVSIDTDGLGVVFGGSVSFSGGSLTVSDLTVSTSLTYSALTAGRVVLAGTAGLLEDDAGLTYVAATNILTNTGGGIVITNSALASATAALTTTGTLSTTNAEQFGISTTITSAGSGASAIQNAHRIALAAGYTGGAATFGIQAINLVAGTGTGGVVQASANYAIGGSVSVTTAGDNVGVSGSAQGGNKSIGGSFIAATNKAGATNIGVTGLGLNGGGGGALQIGGYFGLLGSTPTFKSAALIANNGATTDPGFIVQDNGTDVFTIADGGVATSTGGLVSPSLASAAGAALAISSTSPVSGAGLDVTITAANGVSSGAGGNIVLVPGNRAGSTQAGTILLNSNSVVGLTTTGGPLDSTDDRSLVWQKSNSNGDGDESYVAAVGFRTTSTVYPGFMTWKSRSNTLGTLTASTTGEIIGGYGAKGTATTSAWDTNFAGMFVLSSQTHTGSNQGKYIELRVVADNATAQTTAATLTQASNFGLGTATFGTNATNALALFNGTVPSTSPADTVQHFSLDVAGAGTASMGLRTEQAVAVEVLADTTHTLIININGTAYKWHLTAV